MIKIRNFIFNMINILFIFWMIIILIGAFINPHFQLLFHSKLLFLLPLTIILSFLIVYYVSPVKKLCKYIFIDHKLKTSLSLLAILFIIQLIVITRIKVSISFWDPYAIHQLINMNNYHELIHNKFMHQYISQSPNNLFIILFFHDIKNLIHQNISWTFLNISALICVYLSALINLFTVHLISPSKVANMAYIEFTWILFFPNLFISYSDNFVLPFVSLIILFLTPLINKLEKHKTHKIIYSILLGLSAGITYLIKPSAIIVLFAAFFVDLMYINKKNLLKSLIILLISTCSFVAITKVNQIYIKHQSTYKIIKNTSFPPNHFLAMGITGDGGYNPQLVNSDRGRSTFFIKKQSQKIIVNRFTKTKPSSLIKFFIQKNYLNTFDGSMGWQKEGTTMIDSHPVKGKINNFIVSFLYKNGKNLNKTFILCQLWWIVILCIILRNSLNWKNKNVIDVIIKLGIMGGLLFLLFFEGGRSRYLIQFLPLFLIYSNNYQKIHN